MPEGPAFLLPLSSCSQRGRCLASKAVLHCFFLNRNLLFAYQSWGQASLLQREALSHLSGNHHSPCPPSRPLWIQTWILIMLISERLTGHLFQDRQCCKCFSWGGESFIESHKISPALKLKKLMQKVNNLSPGLLTRKHSAPGPKGELTTIRSGVFCLFGFVYLFVFYLFWRVRTVGSRRGQ